MKYCHLFVFSLLVFLGSCYYDSEEDLYPGVACKEVNISYTTDVRPILENNCLRCHFDGSTIGGGIVLETHDQVATFAGFGSLVGSVKHESPYSAMPKDVSKLSDCNISLIEKWVNEGALNN